MVASIAVQGIDVGGTNTDAILLDHNSQLIYSVKSPTSLDIKTGIEKSLQQLLEGANIDKTKITHAMLGTTQCTNAIVERKASKGWCHSTRLSSDGFRTPLYSLAADMIDKLSGNYAIAHGGYEYDGQLLSELDQQEITKLLEEWRGQVESIAIVGVFSSIKNDQELQVREWIQEVYGVPSPG